MINPQKGIDQMNNNSIINRILFAITIFQHSPLTRRVFYKIIRREREGNKINNIWTTDWHICKSSKVFCIINSIIHNKEMEWHNHHLHQHGSTKMASQQHQHEAGNLQHKDGITTTST
jgi:hypothetical protein